MGRRERPYKDLSSRDLSQLFSDQLRAGRNPVSDYNNSFDKWVFNAKFHNSNTTSDSVNASGYLTSKTLLWSDPIFTTPPAQAVETTFRVGPDGRPEAVTKLVDKPKADSVRNAGESDLAWLRRRVSEVCWVPA